MGVRNSAATGLTMKEYEEQLKKLTAENFNLKLRVYFVEERLSKVNGISDKEDLIKKNIQLKVSVTGNGVMAFISDSGVSRIIVLGVGFFFSRKKFFKPKILKQIFFNFFSSSVKFFY